MLLHLLDQLLLWLLFIDLHLLLNHIEVYLTTPFGVGLLQDIAQQVTYSVDLHIQTLLRGLHLLPDLLVLVDDIFVLGNDVLELELETRLGRFQDIQLVVEVVMVLVIGPRVLLLLLLFDFDGGVLPFFTNKKLLFLVIFSFDRISFNE